MTIAELCSAAFIAIVARDMAPTLVRMNTIDWTECHGPKELRFGRVVINVQLLEHMPQGMVEFT